MPTIATARMASAKGNTCTRHRFHLCCISILLNLWSCKEKWAALRVSATRHDGGVLERPPHQCCGAFVCDREQGTTGIRLSSKGRAKREACCGTRRGDVVRSPERLRFETRWSGMLVWTTWRQAA